MKLRALTVLALVACSVACGDDDNDDTCDRYRAYVQVMAHFDPAVWSETDQCPSDAQIAAKGWPEKTLADCVTFLEEQRCPGIDVDHCKGDIALSDKCGCSVGLGDTARTECAPFSR